MDVPVLEVAKRSKYGRYFVYGAVSNADWSHRRIAITPSAPPKLLPPRPGVIAALANPIGGSESIVSCNVPARLAETVKKCFESQDSILFVVEFSSSGCEIGEVIFS